MRGGKRFRHSWTNLGVPMYSVFIRVDFVLATMLLVVAPLGLLAAAWGRPDVRGPLLVYWRASSLLMVTVYLLIDGRRVAFVAGNTALLCIPLALRYGDILFGTERDSLGSHPVAEAFRWWRRAATIFCAASLPLTLPALRCVAAPATSSVCAAWLAPPRELHAAVHPSLDPGTLGDAALLGLAVYAVYFGASVGRHGWELWTPPEAGRS